MLDRTRRVPARAWDILRDFETRDLTSRNYHARHGGELSKSKADEITSNFIQAREYFRNASTSDISVRPVLQYYGILALSRAMILYLDIHARETSLKSGHGVETDNWQAPLSDQVPRIGDLRIKLTRGTLHELLCISKNQAYFFVDATAINWRAGGDIPNLGSVITFKEIASVIPDISREYESAWPGESRPSVLLREFPEPQETFKWYLAGDIAQADVEAVFPGFQCSGVTAGADAGRFIVEWKRTYVPLMAQDRPLTLIGGGHVRLYAPFETEDIYLSPLAVCFSASYVLAMLARYYPARWTSLGHASRGDAVYPLLTRLMDWLQEAFPLMVAEFLQGPYEGLDKS